MVGAANSAAHFIKSIMGSGFGQGLSGTVSRPFAKFGADAFGNFTGGYLFLGVDALPFKAYDLNHENKP